MSERPPNALDWLILALSFVLVLPWFLALLVWRRLPLWLRLAFQPLSRSDRRLVAKNSGE